MKSFFSLIALAALPAALAFNPHDAGISRRHHHLERKLEEVSLPTETGVALVDNSTTHELGRRAFTNARASWYKVGLGACGRTNAAPDFIVALNAAQFGSGFPGPNCFKKIRISYRGISAVAEIRDRCPGCPYGGLDFSEGLFRHFTGLGTGIIYMQWEFLDGSGGGSTGGGNDDDDDKPTSTRTTRRPSPTPTTSSRRTSSTRTSTSTSRSHATEDDDESTASRTSSSSSTPTPTVETPDNAGNLLQAMLQMTDLLGAASRDAHSDKK